MARVLAVAPDLLMASKVEATLRAAGHEVDVAPSLSAAPSGEAELIVADLDSESPDALAERGAPVLGFYSHVNAETREKAESAGIELAVPRSRLARELPELAARLLAGRE